MWKKIMGEKREGYGRDRWTKVEEDADKWERDNLGEDWKERGKGEGRKEKDHCFSKKEFALIW